MTERLLTADEVVEWLGVPVSWVRESTPSAAVPWGEHARYRRHVRPEMDAWLEECKPGAADAAVRSWRFSSGCPGSASSDAARLRASFFSCLRMRFSSRARSRSRFA
jgi:hypothetical protein